MNIVLASDNNFVQHCAVTMRSILAHNKNVDFFLLTEALTEANSHALLQLVDSMGSRLHIVEVPSEVVQKFPMPAGMSNHISIATYYRLFVCDLLPKDVEKVIYLDCDIVVRKSLEELWDTDISHYALGAIYQYNDWADHNMTWDRLNIPRKYGYFNAGVLLINIKYWRDNGVQDLLLDYIHDNYDRIRSHDQDVLNAVLHENTLPLSYKWNLLAFLFDDFSNWTFPYPELLSDIDSIIKDPCIVHFVNKPKPWKCGCTNPFRHEYYDYLKHTQWSGYKPEFELIPWLENYFWHPLMVRLGRLKRKVLWDVLKIN